MKKILPLFILLCMVFAILTACGTEAGDENIEIESGTVYKDLEEAKFLFVTGWTNEFYPDEGYSDSGDNIRVRYADAEEKFNCTFEVKQFEEGTASGFLRKAIAVNLDVPDMMDTHANNAYPAYKEGWLISMEEINTIDETNFMWGPVKFRQYGIWDGASYGFFPYNWDFIPQYAGTLLFNNELILQNGMKNPYELQEQKQWTWNNFKNELIAGTITTSDKKMVGLGIESIPNFLKSFVMANGGSIVEKVNDKYVFGLESPNAAAAFDYCGELKQLKVLSTASKIDFSVNKKYVYFSTESWNATINVEKTDNSKDDLPTRVMDDWGLINVPDGPNASGNVTAGFVHIGRRLNWLIGMSDNNRDDFGLLLNYIFSPIGNKSEAWKEIADKQFFLYHEAYENFLYTVENCNYDYTAELYSVRSVIESALNSGYSKGVSSVSGYREKIQTEIDLKMNAE